METTCQSCGSLLQEGQRCREEVYEEIDRIIAQYRGKPGAMIPVLHKAQQVLGYLPKDVQTRVAEGLDVPVSDVYGVVSFYALFSTKPKGKFRISICNGTACYVKGAPVILERLEKELGVKAGDTTDDAKFSLEVVRCLGACGLGPVMTVNEEVHARLKRDKIPELVGQYSEGG